MKTNNKELNGNCPNCNSDMVEGEAIEIQGTAAVQPMSCLDCNCEYTDIYKLDHQEIHTSEEE